MRDTASVCGMVLVLLSGPIGQAAAKTPGPAELIGTWRGTSTCTDRVAAPACNDETVVYEFSAGPKPGLVHWKADKIVNGQRVPMGEFDVEYDKTEACWKAEYHGPRVTSVWRLTVKDGHLTGTGRQLPGNQTIRKLDLVPMAPAHATARKIRATGSPYQGVVASRMEPGRACAKVNSVPCAARIL